jgi:peptide methionine sulfoxide reductase msrA/msrB
MPQFVNANLTLLEKQVLFEKATEPAFTGKYDKHFVDGVYVCKNCGKLLYYSSDKFNSGCG